VVDKKNMKTLAPEALKDKRQKLPIGFAYTLAYEAVDENFCDSFLKLIWIG